MTRFAIGRESWQGSAGCMLYAAICKYCQQTLGSAPRVTDLQLDALLAHLREKHPLETRTIRGPDFGELLKHLRVTVSS